MGKADLDLIQKKLKSLEDTTSHLLTQDRAFKAFTYYSSHANLLLEKQTLEGGGGTGLDLISKRLDKLVSRCEDVLKDSKKLRKELKKLSKAKK